MTTELENDYLCPSMSDDDDNLTFGFEDESRVPYWRLSDQRLMQSIRAVENQAAAVAAGSSSQVPVPPLDPSFPVDCCNFQASEPIISFSNYHHDASLFNAIRPASYYVQTTGFGNHLPTEDNAILSTSDYDQMSGYFLESDNAIISASNYNQPTGSEDLVDLDNAILHTSNNIQTMRPEHHFELDPRIISPSNYIQTARGNLERDPRIISPSNYIQTAENLKRDPIIISPSNYIQTVGNLERQHFAMSMDILPTRTQAEEANNGIDENQLRNNACLVVTDHGNAVEAVAVNAEPPPRQVPAIIVHDLPSDGYNWRKYGQKQVKNSNIPRNYFKCSYQNCNVKKIVEYTPEGYAAQVIYKGYHGHPKANPHCDKVSEIVASQMLLNDDISRKRPKYTIAIESAEEVFDDGFRWRKYGHKVVKGNSNPRNYYKCTKSECTVKKKIERCPKDAKLVLTTYEGLHDHEIPETRDITTKEEEEEEDLNTSHDHNQQADNEMDVVETPTTTMENNQQMFMGFENPTPLAVAPPPRTVVVGADGSFGYGGAVVPFVGLHAPPPALGSRVVMAAVMPKVERTQDA